MEKELINIFKEVFQCEDSDIRSLKKFQNEWDSLRHAELILLIHKRLKIKLTWEQIDNLTTFDDVLKLLK